LVVTGLLLGLAGHAWFAGIGGLTIAASGALVGLLCLLPFYISGGMGAGDVKLMAMCGAFLGPLYVAVAAVASLTVGGVLGIAWSFWHFRTDDHFEDETHSISVAASAGSQAAAPAAIPYALAIAAGVLISLKAAPIALHALKGGIS
jgi:prepilin peptidase CpaA